MKTLDVESTLENAYIALLKSPSSYRKKCQKTLCDLRDHLAEMKNKPQQEIQELYEYLVAMSEEKIIMCFELSMPRNNSWNGKWTGDDKYFAVTEDWGKTKTSHDLAMNILYKKDFYYDFGDGWMACVSARRITQEESKEIAKKSRGFAGYYWMVDSIKKHLKIKTEKNE